MLLPEMILFSKFLHHRPFVSCLPRALRGLGTTEATPREAQDTTLFLVEHTLESDASLSFQIFVAAPFYF